MKQTIQVLGVSFCMLFLPFRCATNGFVKMVHDSIGVWTVTTPTDTVLNVAGSTSQGLQEAWNYAHTSGYPFVCEGGSVPPGQSFPSINSIAVSAPLNLPVANGGVYLLHGCDLWYTGDVTLPLLKIDSGDRLRFVSTGQLVSPGTGDIVTLNPVTQNGENNYIGFTASTIDIQTIAIVNALTRQPETTHGVAFHASATNGTILENHIRLGEINGGVRGGKIEVAAGQAFRGNIIVSAGTHNQGGISWEIGAGPSNNLIYGNFWDLQLDPANGTAISIWGNGDKYTLGINGNPATGILLNSSSSQNIIDCARLWAQTPITSNSTTHDNVVRLPGSLGALY